MSRVYDAYEVRAMLSQQAAVFVSDAEYARELGISPCHLSNIFAGRKDPGPKILKQLGLRKVRTYGHHYEKVEG